MKFKDFLKLKEADENTSDDFNVSGVRNRRAGDSPFNDLPFNPKHFGKIINPLVSKVQKFFGELKSGIRKDNQSDSYITKLKLDQESGARSFATLFARILNDIMTGKPDIVDSDKPGVMSAKDPDSILEIVSRLHSLKDKWLLYALVFMIGRNAWAGKNFFKNDRTGSRKFLELLSKVTKDLTDVGENAESAYKIAKAFDSMVKQDPNDYKSMYNKVWRYTQDMVEASRDGNFNVNDIMFMSKDDYEKLYFPKGVSDREDDISFPTLPEDMLLKYQEMRDKLSSTDSRKFVRGSEVDPLVRIFAEYALATDDEEVVKNFVDDVIRASGGSSVAFTQNVINKIDKKFPNVAKYIGKVMDIKKGDQTVDKGVEARKTLAKVKGTDAEGETMSSDDINKLKEELLDAPGSRQWSAIIKRYKNKHKITPAQYKDLLTFLQNDGTLGQKYPGKVNVGTLDTHLAAMVEEGYVSKSYKDYLNKF